MLYSNFNTFVSSRRNLRFDIGRLLAAMAELEQDRNPSAPPAALERLQDALSNADAALKLLSSHGIAPIPRNFAVFYAIAEGNNAPLERSVERILQRSGAISDYDIGEVFEEHLGGDDVGHQQGELREGVQCEVEAALSHLKESADRNDRFTTMLDEVGQDLPKVRDTNGLESTVLHLAHENHIMANHTRQLTAKLNASRDRIQELNEQLKVAQRQSREDPLTGLANRRAFELTLGVEIEKARKSQGKLCLALCDIDHFKLVNDRFGHVVGDSVIRHFSGLLHQLADRNIMAARYGGEEFVLLLPNRTISQAVEVCEHIRSRLESSRLVVRSTGQRIGVITASFGICSFAQCPDRDQLVRKADEQLYRAKCTGRNRTCYGS